MEVHKIKRLFRKPIYVVVTDLGDKAIKKLAIALRNEGIVTIVIGN